MLDGNDAEDPGAAGTAPAVLDADAIRTLSDLVGDDQELITELVDAFLDEAPMRIGELRAGIEQGDLVLAGRAAHTLKSNGFTFGAIGFGELCQQIETAARDGQLDTAAPLVVRVDDEWARLRPALDALRTGRTQ